MPSIKIDFTNINQENCIVIEQLLKQYPNKKLFKKEHAYALKLLNPDTNTPEQAKVKLSHKLIKRACHKHVGEHRYEVLSPSNPIAFGATCELRQSLATITPPQKNRPFSYQQKIQALKLFDATVEIETARHEYTITPRYLKMKPPVIVGDRVGIFMLWAGPTVDTVLEEAENGTNKMTIEQRISLCMAIAKALQTQVHDNDLIHRDLKPGNIGATYDKKTNSWHVHIIDFGDSKRHHKRDKAVSHFGTEEYRPPELARKENTTKKSDIYSLACIYSEILGCTRKPTEKKLQKEISQGSLSLNGLLDTLPDGGKISKEKCVSLLKEMSASLQTDRPALKEIASRLKIIAIPSLTEKFAKLSLNTTDPEA